MQRKIADIILDMIIFDFTILQEVDMIIFDFTILHCSSSRLNDKTGECKHQLPHRGEWQP